ncbi:MAG: DUF1565 domain-containing protein [Candidatus Eisenbacteria bacterium]|nr:DUF1565 domain-containing protein [Candidatus Eisenbacteria bacterium]
MLRHNASLRIATAAALAAVILWLSGCSGGTGPGGDGPPAGHVYVDASNTGTEDGSEEHPFNTIEEALAIAVDGWVVHVAAGSYDVGDTLFVRNAVSIRGAGASGTAIGGTVCVYTASAADTVIIARLACVNVCSFPAPDTTAANQAPVLVRDCALEFVDDRSVYAPPSQWYTLDGCDVAGDVLLAYVDCDAPRSLVACEVAGSFRFSAVSGVSCTVAGSDLGGRVRFSVREIERAAFLNNDIGDDVFVTARDCTTTVVSGNLVEGDTLKFTFVGCDSCRIVGNELPDGGIYATCSLFEVMSIEGNLLENGDVRVTFVGGALTMHGNVITCPAGRDAVSVVTATPTPPAITENVIVLPYDAPTGGLPHQDTAPCGIRVEASTLGSVFDNTVTGGAYGINCYGQHAEIVENWVEGAHLGIAAYGSDVLCGDNLVQDCAGDGVWLRTTGPVEGNVVRRNGGAGVRVRGDCDLGGGAFGSTGGNTLTENLGYDLVVEVLATQADTIFARHNVWDHFSVPDIMAHDVWDSDDDPTLAAAAVAPTASGRERR